MMTFHKLSGGALAAALFVSASGGAFAQAASDRQAALTLGHSISNAAAAAETTATGPAAIEAAVLAALKSLIVSSAADPQVVLTALDDVLTACRPVTGRVVTGWTCPASPGAYVSISSLRSIVVAQINQVGVGALGDSGPTPMGTVPVTSAGAGYKSF
jgi:hypothetical protein